MYMYSDLVRNTDHVPSYLRYSKHPHIKYVLLYILVHVINDIYVYVSIKYNKYAISDYSRKIIIVNVNTHFRFG